jgi:dihydrofolate reductase
MRTKFVLIAAHDPNFVIGSNGKIPWYYPDDLKYFKRVTLGHPIVMGRKTFESIGSKALPGRQNIVLSSTMKDQDSIIVLDDPAKVFDYPFESEKVFIVGGSAIYEYFLPFAEELYITEIKQEFAGDTFFPNYKSDGLNKWKEVSRETHAAFDFVVFKSV